MRTMTPRYYRLRKKRLLGRFNPVSFATRSLSYNNRPTRTIPELREYDPVPYVPDETLTWDSGTRWDSGADWS